jgi:hypothetical protein
MTVDYNEEERKEFTFTVTFKPIELCVANLDLYVRDHGMKSREEAIVAIINRYTNGSEIWTGPMWDQDPGPRGLAGGGH